MVWCVMEAWQGLCTLDFPVHFQWRVISLTKVGSECTPGMTCLSFESGIKPPLMPSVSHQGNGQSPT